MKSAAPSKSTGGRASRPFDGLAAKDIMAKRIITVSPTAPLSEVERLLTENRISGMPVTDSSGRAIGVVSYRDLLDHYAENPDRRAATRRGTRSPHPSAVEIGAGHPDARPRREPGFFRLPTEHLLDEDFESFSVPPESEDTVEDVMTPAIIDVATDASIQEICRTMTKHSVHRVLVTDAGTGRMVGLVSSLCVLAAIAGE